MFVANNRVEVGLNDTGISIRIFISPDKFGVLEIEDESSESFIPSDEEEALFSDHIRKLVEATKKLDMRLTRSNEGSLKRKSILPSRGRGRGRPKG